MGFFPLAVLTAGHVSTLATSRSLLSLAKHLGFSIAKLYRARGELPFMALGGDSVRAA